MKFVILTDTHLVPAGRRLYALDPAARLAAAVELINRDHDDVTFVIVTGDLAHWGEQGAYEALKDRLAALRVPVVLMMGNHDRREAFRAVFHAGDDDGNGFVQAVRHFDHATVVTLDTLGEGRDVHAGRLCPQRLSFLEHALSDAPRDKPVLLFQHHPPLELGLPHMDAFKLQDSEAEWQVLQRTRMPDFMFFGHIHRPAAGVWRGIPFIFSVPPVIRSPSIWRHPLTFRARTNGPTTLWSPSPATISSSFSARFCMKARHSPWMAATPKRHRPWASCSAEEDVARPLSRPAVRP